MFLRHTVVVLCGAVQSLSSRMAQEEDDHLRPTQEELMTPESTSSVSPPPRGQTLQEPRSKAAAAEPLFMYHQQNLLTAPQSTPHITL